MTSWVYVFSQFTPEALLFEALIIFFLLCSYTAFWILKKRRFGSADQTIPSGAVRAYLNELITNAEQLRLQLFGLLSASDKTGVSVRPVLTAALPAGGDAELNKRYLELDAKFQEQVKTVEALSAAKAELEKQLAAGAGKSAGGALADPNELEALKQKIQELEAKLFEYSIIEDDLANLKRLQQENALLKSSLNKAGIPIPAVDGVAIAPSKGGGEPPPPSAPAATAESVAEAPAPAEPVVPEPEGAEAAAPPPEPEPVVEAPAEPASPSAEEAPPAEGSVQASPEEAAAAAAAAAKLATLTAAAAPAQAPAGAQAAPANPDLPPSETETEIPPPGGAKGPSNDDLLADFEKMLKS